MTNAPINETFTQRKAGIECPMCPDTMENDVVAELSSGKVHLQNDADYRGYCILICRRHAVEIHDLSLEEQQAWITDIARIGKAITEICAPAKLNLSMLGNQVPHLHCHLMPRYPDDPEWGRPPLFRPPAERSLMRSDEYEHLKSALAEKLKTGG